MKNKINYGIISDIHKDPRIIHPTLEILTDLGAEKLIVNGDIGERMNSLEDTQKYTAGILDALGKSEKECFIQPGSHETVGAFQPVLDAFCEKYPNLISALKVPKVENGNHHLVFLPGSDFVCGGEYQIGNDENIETGLYKTQSGFLHYQNMNDLRNLVSNGEKTISICHVPRKFDRVEGAVDVAYFAENSDGSIIPGVVLENQIRQKYGKISDEKVKQIASDNGLNLREENRGNEGLRDLYNELGITKAVSGHFHESGHRAHDGNVNPIQQETLVDELYWNSGCLDVGETGILTVDDGRVSYKNINLEEHLK